MKRIKKEQLEELLASKPFSELTAEERYFVTEIMDETEYGQMHFLAKNASPILKDTPAPNPAIKENLMEAMRQMKAEARSSERKPLVLRLLKTRIPAWQAAAAIAMLLGAHFLFPNEHPVEVLTKTEYVYQTDTIYREVAISTPPPAQKPEKRKAETQLRVNMKPSEAPLPRPEQKVASARAEALTENLNRAGNTDTFALMVSHPKGQSATQTEDLMQFLGEFY